MLAIAVEISERRGALVGRVMREKGFSLSSIFLKSRFADPTFSKYESFESFTFFDN